MDEKHFTVQAKVEISDMFYAWGCGFGRRAKILEPPQETQKLERPGFFTLLTQKIPLGATTSNASKWHYIETALPKGEPRARFALIC